MEAPFLAKLHAYAERLTNITSGLQYWHKGIIYFLYVRPLFVALVLTALVRACGRHSKLICSIISPCALRPRRVCTNRGMFVGSSTGPRRR